MFVETPWKFDYDAPTVHYIYRRIGGMHRTEERDVLQLRCYLSVWLAFKHGFHPTQRTQRNKHNGRNDRFYPFPLAVTSAAFLAFVAFIKYFSCVHCVYFARCVLSPVRYVRCVCCVGWKPFFSINVSMRSHLCRYRSGTWFCFDFRYSLY